MAAPAWIHETWRTYIGNAASVRDFRVQMRGSKTILAWTLYLGILLTVGYFTYASVSALGFGSSPAEIQYRLGTFFSTMFRVIAGAVVVIAPGLTAASIVGERQRKSFDLVFSAPVTPKYYLVGKMIASFRYTLILLVLSIPVLAVSALLGGATWADIAICYLLLSLSGLIITSIALLVSALVEKVQAAVALSYFLTGVFLFGTFLISAYSMFATGRSGGPISEAPFLATLNPFMIPETYGTYSVFRGMQIPNWMLVLPFTFIIVRFALLGAGSALSPFGSPETKGLRFQGLLYLAAFCLLFLLLPASSGRRAGDAQYVTYVAGCLTAFVPWIATFGDSARKVTQYDGGWSIRRVFLGTPSGAGPYLAAMVGVLALCSVIIASNRGLGFSSVASHLAHGVGMIAFFAGACRAYSAKFGFEKGRTLGNATVIFLQILLPLFVMIVVASFYSGYGAGKFEQDPLWGLWPLWPLVADYPSDIHLVYGAISAGFGLWFWTKAEAAATRRLKLAGIEA